MCFVWISEQTAIISLYGNNLSGFITEAESVYCAVRIGSLNQTYSVVLKGLNYINLFGIRLVCMYRRPYKVSTMSR